MTDALPLDTVLEGDCVSLMGALPDASVDVVFADPPYNLQLKGELRRPNESVVAGVDAAWDKFAGFDVYDRFTRAWLSEARRLLKPDGSLWVIGSYHNIFRVGAVLQDLGFWILNDVIWRKTNPMPNFRGKRLTNAHETLIWAGRSDASRPVFNYDAAKTLNDGLQLRSDWTLPICAGAERLKDRAGGKLHPTQKPEALLHRALVISTNPGQVVLDPFFGTGTTGAVAKRLGRRFIGLEADPTYAAAARERIAQTPAAPRPALAVTASRRDAPRLPFGRLVESGMIEVGEELRSACGVKTAQVRADGSLVTDGATGSIHQVGAYAQGAQSCNGWAYWHAKRDGEWTPIDALRQRALAEMQG